MNQEVGGSVDMACPSGQIIQSCLSAGLRPCIIQRKTQRLRKKSGNASGMCVSVCVFWAEGLHF